MKEEELTSFSQEMKSIHVAVVADLSQLLSRTQVEIMKVCLLLFSITENDFSRFIFLTEYIHFLDVKEKRRGDFSLRCKLKTTFKLYHFKVSGGRSAHMFYK